MLEMDLYKLIHEVGYKPMFLCAIQPIAKQVCMMEKQNTHLCCRGFADLK